MKKLLHILLFGVTSFALSNAAAQQQAPTIRFANGEFTTGNNIQKKAFKKEDIASTLFADQYFVIVQFGNLPGARMVKDLQKAGVNIGQYIPGNAYLATIAKTFDFNTAPQFGVISINAIPASFKISTQLKNYQPQNDKNNTPLIAVSFFETADKKTIEQQLQNAGAVIIKNKYTSAGIIFISAATINITTIAAMPFVVSLNLQFLTDKPLNYFSRAAHGTGALNAAQGKNLNGKNVTIGVGDNANISTHIDFVNRTAIRTPGPPANHGTHVAGTLAGAGIINIKYHGMAPKANLVNQFYSDIITNAPTYITDYNMVITNNSYYSGQDKCAGDGAYDVFSNYADKQTGGNKQLLHVVASGNDGLLTCSAYPASFGTVKSGWQTAKNVLTVGALNLQDYSIASFSSRGPVSDGRLKPEITANGWAVISTFVNNTYGADYGTSMATPTVAGSLALVYEKYRQLHSGANPSAALVKALACNSAIDLGNPGPDYTFGFGMLNARKAVSDLEANTYFSAAIGNGNNAAQIITVPANARRLKVMLYWADTAAATNAATTLVNDLDLTVTNPSAIVHRPLILNSTAANVNDVAVEGADHLNNIEQVVIDNPAAGNYSINIAGFSVPSGPQNYVVAYEITQPGVTVEYPFGGETFVPSETETLRWLADGNETNTQSIDYSLDNGSTWISINNAVPAGSRSFSWLVPSTITNNALIRVSRNGTALTGQSTYNFVIAGQPVITASNACEGAVQLDWGGVPGATTYDVLQLTGDSMKVIANTAANSFLLTGLNKNKVTWLAVTAKNGLVAGRRSISVSILPGSGPCNLPVFNNDIKVDTILTPNTGRRYFSNAVNATAPVQVLLKNTGTIDVAAPVDISYSYGGAVITETTNAVIAAGKTFLYTFTGAYPKPVSGYKYNFKAWATLPADANHQNDTALKTVQFINNDPVVLPLAEGFEAMPDTTITTSEMAIGNNKYADFSTSTIRGRGRTFVNTGFARTGNRSITLDQSPYSAFTNADSLTLNYNLINYATGQLRFDLYYNNHGQDNYPNNKIWIRGSENDVWLPAYDLFINQANLGFWKHAIINVNDILNSVTPAQAITPTFQIRVGQQGATSANNPYPVVDNDDGYTFDDLTLSQAINDLALIKIISPDKTGCSLTANSPISITVKNYNNAALNNITVSYQVNGGAIVSEIIPVIGASQTLDYTFTNKADLAAYKDYSINTWIHYAGDNYAANDSVLNYSLHNTPVITTYPYVESFENSDGYFYTKGTNSTWQWGTPAKKIINKAPNGKKAWATNLTGNYNDEETSYLYTPCFDVSSLKQPVLSFSHIFDLELDYDFSWVEYSTDGVIWNKLGAYGSGTNWYDNAGGVNWRSLKQWWHVASIDIPVTNGNVRFRFVLSSDAGVTMEGIGIDDVSIHEKINVAVNPPVTSIKATLADSNKWVPFMLPVAATGVPYILAEMNANGQNLGEVNIELYPNLSGAVRNKNNQYYLDRNFVIRPANPPRGNVGVRLYFTDAEADSLITAKNCLPCLKPADAYGLGVTKYSGSLSEENGTLDDDLNGFFQYFSPDSTTVVPHGNGYYAEFTVNSFSEFWLNNGGAKTTMPLPVNLFSFEAVKEGRKANLSWKTQNEMGTARFTVERSSNAINFTAIGSIAAKASAGTSQYMLTDSLPMPGINYYRIRITGRDGKAVFSANRKLDFSNSNDDILIYPNPTANNVLYIASSGNGTSALLYDASGKIVGQFVLQGRNNTIKLKGFSKGIYIIKVITENGAITEKLLLQ